MKRLRCRAAAMSLCAAVGMTGCVTRAPSPMPVPPPAVSPGTAQDVVPRAEPRSRYGNPPYYDVFGRRYYVLPSSKAYVERGVASWYGPGFHKIRTSTGEIYDMYGMTAAHKTLPLPVYVRVTNLENGRSVVVRVNDRGPFVGNRLIDLSYTAAARLDMLRNGTAMVEVRALDPGAPAPPSAPPPAPSSGGEAGGTGATVASATVTGGGTPLTGQAPPAGARLPLFLQAGAFTDPANAARLAARLRDGNYGSIFVRDDVVAGRRMYRVRIGPVADVPAFDRLVAALESVGVRDAHLAMD